MSSTVARRPGSPPQERELSEASILTSHRVLEGAGSDAVTLDILRTDLFDARPRVICSALRGLEGIGDAQSVSLIARLFSHPDPGVVAAAARAVGALNGARSLPVLIALSATTRHEGVKLEVLRTLARHCPGEADVRGLALAFARAAAVQPDVRASALEILLQICGEQETSAILDQAGGDPEVHLRLLAAAQGNRAKTAVVACHYARKTTPIPIPVRLALLPLVAPVRCEESAALILDAIRDGNPRVRREAYRALGRGDDPTEPCPALLAHLLESVEEDGTLEEEALQGIDRLAESFLRGEPQQPLDGLKCIEQLVASQFELLRASFGHEIDTSHETGWQIAHAKEYLEFYGSEEMKKAIVLLLKGKGDGSLAQRCARMLKDSAVKVEVRHFDGYKALRELLAQPQRPGAALFLRHFALSNTARRGMLCRLKRSLGLARMSQIAAAGLYRGVYCWARREKLYRLAERGLFALHHASPAEAFAACRECMTPPITSKVLAIAALGLMKGAALSSMDASIVTLLHETDRYVRLSLMEALAGTDSVSEPIVRAMLQRFAEEDEREMATKLAELLGAKADIAIAIAMIEVFGSFADWKKALTVSMMRSIARRMCHAREPALAEFLYRLLRSEDAHVLVHVPAALHAIHDDYSGRVFVDLAGRLSGDGRIAMLRDIGAELPADAVAGIRPLLVDPDARLQETLAEVLPTVGDDATRSALQRLVKDLRRSGGAEDPPSTALPDPAGGATALASEKDHYRFEREHIRCCGVVFSDIQGYSTKAQEMSSMEITTLIQEYECILLPIMEAHRGALVKRMGDGHLFTFAEPLAMVLAAIRVQKALARFNRFRPENLRVMVRIGLHWGEVVEKGGDVFGNTVNIAARLQSTATPGSLCVSHAVYDKTAQWIHALDLGEVTVKGIREPIRVWEPTEISLELPAERDPLKQLALNAQPNVEDAKRAARKNDGDTDTPRNAAVERQALDELLASVAEAFQALRLLARKCAGSDSATAILEGELVRRWRSLKPLAARLRREQRG